MSVSAKIEVIIKDACIFFDLIDLDMMDVFYKLELIVITTPEVINEIEDPAQLSIIQQYIDTGSLQLDKTAELMAVLGIIETNPGLNLADAAVLDVATRRKASVLSADKSLRNESARRGLTVRGLLWVIEELWRKEILTIDQALKKLALYPQVNCRAPKKEIEILIAKLIKQNEDSIARS